MAHLLDRKPDKETSGSTTLKSLPKPRRRPLPLQKFSQQPQNELNPPRLQSWIRKCCYFALQFAKWKGMSGKEHPKLCFLTRIQDRLPEDERNLRVRVKKALAFCRRCTRLPAPKRQADSFDEYILRATASRTSIQSLKQKAKSRPIFGFARSYSMKVPKTRSPPPDYIYNSESDPFITSPTWFKAEFSTEERRVGQTHECRCCRLGGCSPPSHKFSFCATREFSPRKTIRSACRV